MPTKQSIRVIKSKDRKRLRVSLSLAFDIDDPRAERIFKGIALCLHEAFTDDEAREFMRLLEGKRLELVA
jgi:hypothetical protein